MLIVKRPTVIIFGWKDPGYYNYISELNYPLSSIYGWVDIFSYNLSDLQNWNFLFMEKKADLIFSIGEKIDVPFEFFRDKIFHLEEFPDDSLLTSLIMERIIEQNCNPYKPKFSVFTPTYCIGDRITKTFESLQKQTFTDWEWVVVDDSPKDQNETWEILLSFSKIDPRVKIHRNTPNSNGFVGSVKKKACLLSNGEFLVELDHDDYLLSECLETILNASEKFKDAGFFYSDCSEVDDFYQAPRFYYDSTEPDFYGKKDNSFNFGYSGNTWEIIDGKKYLRHHYPSINPLTIRFNISMPNHVRVWKKDLYFKIGGHRDNLPVADDYELIIRTFLETRIVQIKKLLYVQRYKFGSTVDENSFEINRRARMIRDWYDKKIHERISELGFFDWEWVEESGKCFHQDHFYKIENIKFHDEEQVLNYIYE
jgi:glycosyltransferase involved in cell wall biosynthesis